MKSRVLIALVAFTVFTSACVGESPYDGGWVAPAEGETVVITGGSMSPWEEVKSAENLNVTFLRAEITLTFSSGPELKFEVIDKQGQSVDSLAEYRAADFYLKDHYKDPATGEEAIVLRGEQQSPVNQNCHGYTLWHSLNWLAWRTASHGAEFWVNPGDMRKVVSDNRLFENTLADQVLPGDVVIFGGGFDHSGIVSELGDGGNHLIKSSNGEEPVILARVNALVGHYGGVYGYYRPRPVE
jgi:hypothetical protein